MKTEKAKRSSTYCTNVGEFGWIRAWI